LVRRAVIERVHGSRRSSSRMPKKRAVLHAAVLRGRKRGGEVKKNSWEERVARIPKWTSRNVQVCNSWNRTTLRIWARSRIACRQQRGSPHPGRDRLAIAIAPESRGRVEGGWNPPKEISRAAREKARHRTAEEKIGATVLLLNPSACEALKERNVRNLATEGFRGLPILAYA